MLNAVKRRLWLLNRRRLQRRELARRIDYATWCQRYDTLGSAPAVVEDGPLLGLTLDVSGASPAAVEATWQSIQSQWYLHWRLFVQGGEVAFAGHPQVRHGAPEGRDWIAALTPGERWREHALLHLAQAARAHPEARLIYADHDTRGADGVRRNPCFKPDWNADWLLAKDWVQTPLLWRSTGVRGGHAALLQATEGLQANEVHHVPRVLVHRPDGAPTPAADAEAVETHLARRGETATAERGKHGVRVRFALPATPPRVSIVVPTRNGLALLRTCITSIVERTSYPDFEIVIVDNGSDDAECLAYLDGVTRDPRIRVRRDGRPFNFAALNNAALADCRGSVLALVNNDIEVIDGGWLDEMVALALRPGVGAVGARLLYSDRTVQHAGVVLGIHGGSGHVHRRIGEHDAGYMERALQLQSLSAVTAACLVVQRRHYEAVGGMDEVAFPVTFNDTDLCLRLNAAGLRTLYTPHATLFHHESVTRGSDRDGTKRAAFERARATFAGRWPQWVADDPAYNPNLTLAAEHFGLAEPPRTRSG